MASFTLPQVAESLYTRKLPFSLDPVYNWITIYAPADNFWIYFQPTNNGDYLKVSTSTLLHVKDSVYICKIFGKMFELQEEFQILRFGHNKGNVDSYGWLVSHHMLDGTINDLNFLLQVAMPTLKVVQATGEEPSQESQVDSILEDLS